MPVVSLQISRLLQCTNQLTFLFGKPKESEDDFIDNSNLSLVNLLNSPWASNVEIEIKFESLILEIHNVGMDDVTFVLLAIVALTKPRQISSIVAGIVFRKD